MSTLIFILLFMTLPMTNLVADSPPNPASQDKSSSKQSKFIDLDGDGFDDTRLDLNGDGIPESSETQPPSHASATNTNAFAFSPFPSSNENTSGLSLALDCASAFSKRSRMSKSLWSLRGGLESADKFGPENGISGVSAGGHCEGGVCAPR